MRPATVQGRAIGRWLQIGLSLYASVVLVAVWVGWGYGVAVDPAPLGRAWDWLGGLPPLPQVVAWILFLPSAVGLWAWHADLPTVGRFLVGAGLVGWSLVALRSLFQALFRTVHADS